MASSASPETSEPKLAIWVSLSVPTVSNVNSPGAPTTPRSVKVVGTAPAGSAIAATPRANAASAQVFRIPICDALSSSMPSGARRYPPGCASAQASKHGRVRRARVCCPNPGQATCRRTAHGVVIRGLSWRFSGRIDVEDTRGARRRHVRRARRGPSPCRLAAEGLAHRDLRCRSWRRLRGARSFGCPTCTARRRTRWRPSSVKMLPDRTHRLRVA